MSIQSLYIPLNYSITEIKIKRNTMRDLHGAEYDMYDKHIKHMKSTYNLNISRDNLNKKYNINKASNPIY